MNSAEIFAGFIHFLFPALRELIFSKLQPQFEDNDENKIRHAILEIMARFPQAADTTLRQQIPVLDVMTICFKVIQEDNETNGTIAVKLVFELHKTYRPSLESSVPVSCCLLLLSYFNGGIINISLFRSFPFPLL